MKKDIEWLKQEIGTEMIQLEPNRKERWSDVKYQTLRDVAQKIDQLDEPEVTLDKAFEKVAESYSMTKEEVWRRIEWFETHTEVLSQEWIDDHKVARINNLRKMTTDDVVSVKDLQNLLVPKQEEVDLAYKDGYEKGKEYTFYKGYLEGLGDKEKEPETVASVIADFYKSFERFKEVISMEVKE